jgi:hypothetical protein
MTIRSAGLLGCLARGIAAGGVLAATAWAAVPVSHPGWPVTISRPAATYIQSVELQVGDLAGDGSRKLAAVWTAGNASSGGGSVSIISADGLVEAQYDDPYGLQAAPVFVDRNDDGEYELVVAGYSSVLMLDIRGNLLWKHQRGDGDPTWDRLSFVYVSVGDLDGDGRLWIVCTSRKFATYVFDLDGNLRPGWPVISDSYFSTSSASIADIDGDGKGEIVFGSTGSEIQCLKADGSICSGWPYSFPGLYMPRFDLSQPVIFREPNGDARIAAANGNRPGAVHLIDKGGLSVSPFPLQYADLDAGGECFAVGQGGGRLWLTVGGWTSPPPFAGNHLVDLGTGAEAPGWPAGPSGGGGGIGNPVIGDIGQPGEVGFLFGEAVTANTAVVGFDFDGSPLPGYPRLINEQVGVRTIALGTLDGSNTTICWSTGSQSDGVSHIDCFDVGVPWDRGNVQYGNPGFDLQHTNYWRRLWQIDRPLTCLTTTAPTAPVAGAAFDVVVSPLDKTGAGLGPDQQVRFARRPVVGRFTGPVIYDAANGTYRRRYVSDPCATGPYDIEFRVFVNEELDDSMPVVHFEPRSVSVDHPSYRCSRSVAIRVADGSANADLATAETLVVQATSGSEPAGEPVTVTETGADTGVFSGTIPLSTVDTAGTLLVSDGDTIGIRYTAAAGSCPVSLVTAASIDCAAPVISGVAVTDETPTSASILWTTSEPGTSVVEWGTSPSLGSSASVSGLATSHSVPLAGLTACVPYFFRVRSADVAENIAVDDNAGALYSFTLFPSYQRTASAPAILSPAAGATDLPLTTTLTWSPSTDVSRYEIRLGTTSPPPVVAEASATTTIWPLVLSSGTAYAVQVVAFPSDGSNPPTPSPVVFFTTADSPALAVSAAAPAVVDRWGGPITMTISGNGFDAASTFEPLRPGHSAGVFAGTPTTPTSVDGVFTPDLLAPAGWYDLRLVQGGAFVAGMPHAFVLRAFADVTESDWYFEASERMVTEAILPGFAGPYGPEFRPTIPLTRAEITQAVVRAHFWQLGGTPPLRTCLSPYFPDVPCSHPQRNEIEWAKDLGIALGGADGNFHPSSLVTRAEMAAFVVRLLYNGEPNVPKCQPDPGWSDLAEIPDWSEPYVNLLRAKRLTAGCQASPLAFCSLGNVQRSDLAVFLGRAVGEVEIK